MKTFSKKCLNMLTAMLPALLLTLFTHTRSAASHFAAGQIYLTYIGEGADGCSNTSEYKYLLVVDIYRACEGGSPAPVNITVDWGSVNAGVSSFTSMANPQRDTLHELCEAFVDSNSCRYPITQTRFPAYIRHRFTDTLILPSAQTDWKFSYRDCCRNVGIANGSANGWFYIETGLNNLTRYNNSTPRFQWEPLPYICANQPTRYLNGAYDLDGDSLFTTVEEPLDNAGVSIPYTSPYSVNDPIGVAPGTKFQFDPATATASFTPSTQGRYVMAFRSEEFDRATGISLGYVIRDAQVSVFPCTAPPPALDTLPPIINNAEIVKINGQNVILACPGSKINFTMSTQSASSTSQVYLQADLDPLIFPGASFSVTGAGSQKVTGEFDWTPTSADIGEKTLTIISKDSTCSGANFAIVL